ncbi:cyclin-dependent kinase 2-associated protein 1-like isoform X1 [Montipora capricornis]|uniref:cyclin-dependent kinase 2-associated protein 1-like isoform X1 n=1 Tax=Montipora capricornis TaxID=246305 RepID=UPI0035F16A2E
MESIQSKTQPAAQGANVLATSSPQASSSSAAATNQNSPGKYSELLAVIEELGKDIRPTYAGSKNAAERLKKGKWTGQKGVWAIVTNQMHAQEPFMA